MQSRQRDIRDETNINHPHLIKTLDTKLLSRVRQEIAEAKYKQEEEAHITWNHSITVHSAWAKQLITSALSFFSPFRSKAARESANLKPKDDLLSSDRLIYHIDVENPQNPQTIVKARSITEASDRSPLTVSLKLYHLMKDDTRLKNHEKDNIEQLEEFKFDKNFSDSDGDLFSDAGDYDASEIVANTTLEESIVEQDIIKKSIKSDKQSLENVNRAIRESKIRLKEDEIREQEKSDLAKKLLTEVKVVKPEENPFTLKNASLIPLAKQPARLHHASKGFLNKQLQQRKPDENEEDEFDADYEYGIDLGGQEFQSCNYQQYGKPKRRKKDLKHDVKDIMKRVEKLKETNTNATVFPST